MDDRLIFMITDHSSKGGKTGFLEEVRDLVSKNGIQVMRGLSITFERHFEKLKKPLNV